MNLSQKKSLGRSEFYTLVITTLSIAAIAIASMTVGEVIAQNATGTATNQTGTSTFGNLTAADLQGVRSDLATARDAIHDNDVQLAYLSLGFVDNGLFGVAVDAEPERASFEQQLTPVRDAIENAQDALLQDDIAKALEHLNTVDVTLLKVTEMLPSGEEAEEAEEPEE